jgi:hypothetical protein
MIAHKLNTFHNSNAHRILPYHEEEESHSFLLWSSFLPFIPYNGSLSIHTFTCILLKWKRRGGKRGTQLIRHLHINQEAFVIRSTTLFVFVFVSLFFLPSYFTIQAKNNVLYLWLCSKQSLLEGQFQYFCNPIIPYLRCWMSPHPPLPTHTLQLKTTTLI